MRGLIRRLKRAIRPRRPIPDADLAELLCYYSAIMDTGDGMQRLRRLVALEAWCEDLCYHRGWDYPPRLPREGRVEWGHRPRWVGVNEESRP